MVKSFIKGIDKKIKFIFKSEKVEGSDSQVYETQQLTPIPEQQSKTDKVLIEKPLQVSSPVKKFKLSKGVEGKLPEPVKPTIELNLEGEKPADKKEVKLVAEKPKTEPVQIAKPEVVKEVLKKDVVVKDNKESKQAVVDVAKEVTAPVVKKPSFKLVSPK